MENENIQNNTNQNQPNEVLADTIVFSQPNVKKDKKTLKKEAKENKKREKLEKKETKKREKEDKKQNKIRAKEEKKQNKLREKEEKKKLKEDKKKAKKELKDKKKNKAPVIQNVEQKEGAPVVKPKKKNFFVKNKLYFLIGGGVLLLILIGLFTFAVIRINYASDACRTIINQDYYSRKYITDELKAKGFNDFEIDNAIKRNKIDFNVNANKSLYKIIEKSDSFLGKAKLKEELMNQGYTEEEINFLFATINWEELYETNLTNYFATHTEPISKNTFLSDLQRAGFDQSEIDIISKSKQWNEKGKEYIEYFFEHDSTAGKNDAKNYLILMGFSEDEAETIFNQINWKEQALKCINNYLNDADNFKDDKTEVEITKALFEKVLKDMDFSDDEIKYAIDNFDFSSAIQKIIQSSIKTGDKIINKNNIKNNLLRKQFTETEITKAFEKISWNEYAYTTCSEYLLTNKANKNDALKYLSSVGYTVTEVDYAEKKFTWSTYAVKALGYLQENNKKTKDELLNTLKEYGYSETDIATAKSKTSFVTHAFNYVINTQSSDSVSKMCQKEVEKVLSNGGYSDEAKSVVSKFNYNTNAKNYLGSLLSTYKDNATTYSIDEIVKKITDKGFTDSNASDALSKYDWKGFGEAWVKKYFKNNEVNKSTFNDTYNTMYIDKSSTLLSTKYTPTDSMWTEEALSIASSHKADGKEAVQLLLESYGYSSEDVQKALKEYFPETPE